LRRTQIWLVGAWLPMLGHIELGALRAGWMQGRKGRVRSPPITPGTHFQHDLYCPPWALLLGIWEGMLTVSDDMPRYLFLMRHAKHDEGRLTEGGSAHIRSLAMRLCEWVRAEWRQQPERTVRLWFTSTSAEVQDTADALARDVLAHARQGKGLVHPYPLARPPGEQYRTGEPGDDRQPWMPALVPFPRGKERDLGNSLSAYSPDEEAFQDLCKWLEASDIGQESARRTEMDAPLLVGIEPLIGGWLQS
jgi:hypothetical protein